MQNKVTETSSPREAALMAVLAWRCNYALCMVGMNGIGKDDTAVMLYEAMKKKNEQAKYWLRSVAAMWPEEIAGFNMPIDDAKAEFGKRLVSLSLDGLLPFGQEAGLLHWGEFDRAESHKQNSLAALLWEKQVHEFRLSPNVYQICSMNGSSDTGTTKISKQLRGRMVFCYMGTNSDSWYDSFDQWADKKNINPKLKSFNRANRFAVQELDEMASDQARTRVMAENLYTMGTSMKTDPTIIRRAMQGVCGQTIGSMLFAWLDSLTLQDILAMSPDQINGRDQKIVADIVAEEIKAGKVNASQKLILKKILSGETMDLVISRSQK